MANYLTSVGMEVHVELSTASKMFCRCKVAFGGEPNTRVCPVCMGLPGALPKPNRAAIEYVLKTALALNCTIARRSVFHRKNYFYPDLPKGYQISQYEETNPIGYHGFLMIPTPDGSMKRIGIKRVHLEEDTGKLMHLPSGGSGVDYNRSGTPLMEIVTDFPPDITNQDEAKEYLHQLRMILLYLGVTDGKMEEGSMRCEPNISIRLEGSEKYGTKTELKNLNSYRSVQQGVQYEVRRQTAVLEQGGTVLQETRGWNEANESSFVMRVKEHEDDYRYFTDPDLVPLMFTEEEIESFRAALPELPLAKANRYKNDYGLSEYDANLLIGDKDWAAYFEVIVGMGGDPKAVCNLMNSEFAKHLNESGQSVRPGHPEPTKITPAHIMELLSLQMDRTINGKIAKEILAESFLSGEMPAAIVKKRGITQISDEAQIGAVVREVLGQNADAVIKYKSGQTNVMGFLVGQVMRQTQGRANPEIVNRLVRQELES